MDKKVIKVVAESSSSSSLVKNIDKGKFQVKSVNSSNTSNASLHPKLLKPEEYGRPKAGTLTDLRGKKANVHVYREMLELCQVIYDDGKPVDDQPDLRVISFGELFDIYVNISNKVVGLLLRARKYNLLNFEGEILFQRFHDHVPIKLMHPMSEIKEVLTYKQDEVGL